jgi:hypothetical protein
VIVHGATTAGYDLKVNGRVFGQAIREHDGSFSLVNGDAFLLADQINFSTMAGLKAALEPLVPDDYRRTVKREWKPTQYDVRMAGGSHARTGAAIREACQIWPEKAKIPGWINKWLIRRKHELMALFGHEGAKEWLTDHPGFGAYDHADFTRRCEAMYGPQPSWTY